MALKIEKVDVWAAPLRDRPGSLAGKLCALEDAGANLGFVIARRTGKKSAKKGVAFLTPLSGAKQLAAARKTGFKKTKSLHSVRIEGANRRGVGAEITTALAEAGINIRGLSAAAIGSKFVCHVAFDKTAEATKAARVLRRL